MSSPAPGAVLATYLGAFLDELAGAGVRDVCLCPGSRSTPLALILQRHPAFKLWMQLDERSCAYFALGMAKASHRPVALLCTSGTAAVNFAPAVVEAFQSRVPLVVLTADRPQELRELGANQTIDQPRLYGSSVKWSAEMLLPEVSPEALRYARLAAARAVATAIASAPGPVHLNFPFREPLVPDRYKPQPSSVRLAVKAAPARATDEQLSGVLEALAQSYRALVVCGPQDDGEFPAAVTSFANAFGLPLLADPLSGVRCGAHYAATILGAYDSFLRDAGVIERLAPDLVLRFGAAPVSKPVASYLQRYRDVPQLLVSPPGLWRDPDLTASSLIHADATAFCRDLAAGPTDNTNLAWLGAWQDVERATVKAIERRLSAETDVTEPGVFSELAPVLPPGSTVFAGNSMPVRDLDSFFPAGPGAYRFLANRGASGIDGVVSSALGAAAVSLDRLVLVIGDLSFYHDMNGLIAARRFGLDATIVLVNNDGGGIFSFLPQANDPDDFEALFGTPHGLDFAPVAQLYGLEYCRVETLAGYRDALVESFARSGVSVIEVRTDREQNLRLHQEIWREVASAPATAAVK